MTSTMREMKSAVLDVRPMLRGSEKAVVESVLGRQPGVHRVDANPVAQTATVSYDPGEMSVAQLRRVIEECGYHCRGQSVPNHLCDPAAEPRSSRDAPDDAREISSTHRSHHAASAGSPNAPAVPATHGEQGAGGHAGHGSGHHPEGSAAPDAPAVAAAHGEHGANGHAEHGSTLRSPDEVMGHGGHGGMSMAAMVADMRNRFLVAAAFAIPIVLWSRIGRHVLGFTVAAPFGLSDDVWQLLLSLPVVFYACSIYFTGAVRALRARTLDMMVLVAVAVATRTIMSSVRARRARTAPVKKIEQA